jgi:hypothetical protein
VFDEAKMAGLRLDKFSFAGAFSVCCQIGDDAETHLVKLVHEPKPRKIPGQELELSSLNRMILGRLNQYAALNFHTLHVPNERAF